MYIESISLSNFRNYENLQFEPSSGVNVLYGLNAQGKSAILEAMYLLATSKSHRTSKDLELIKIGNDVTRVQVDVKRSARNDVSLEMALSKTEKKTVRIDKSKQQKIGDLVGQLNAVIFSSMDIDMVRGEPSLRRRFLNLEISQISPHYIYALGRYKRVLDQRNNMLREVKIAGSGSDSLDVWDNQMASYGATVIARRGKFINFLSDSAARVYALLTDDGETLKVAYKPSLDVNIDASEEEIATKFNESLLARREYDIMRGTTGVGPHRDDITLSIDGLHVREYGSQGQQRSVAVALKLAEIDLMKESIDESPVVLLDDVMAELDEIRRARVFDIAMGGCQTFITTTHLDEMDERVSGTATVFRVDNGTVTRK